MPHRASLRWMVLATLGTGLGAGLGGAALTWVLHVVQHTSFGDSERTFLQGVRRASHHRRVLALAGGGLLAGVAWWVQRRRTPVDISVERAVRDDGVELPLVATVVDSLIQIVAVGTGAALGREGAPRQVGAALAARLGPLSRLDHRQRRTLIACGAGAGLAAVYDVPLSGAAFALEILLGSLALADMVPAVVTSAVAAVTAWPFLGRHPTYAVPSMHLDGPLVVGSLLLGPLAVTTGTGFLLVTGWAHRHRPSSWRVVPAVTLAFTVIGVLATVRPEVPGNGKGAAQTAFDAGAGLSTLAVLLLLRPLATVLCLRAGARGGLLTPALATGALLGAVGGDLWEHVWPGSPPGALAVVGAAAVLATTQRAPVTAVLLALELTHVSLVLVLPIALAVAPAAAVAWLRPSAPRARARRPARRPSRCGRTRHSST